MYTLLHSDKLNWLHYLLQGDIKIVFLAKESLKWELEYTNDIYVVHHEQITWSGSLALKDFYCWTRHPI